MAVITSFVGSDNSWTIILFFLSWFWKVLEDARCETTRNCYICAGWTGLVQEKNVISWCIIWGPGLARKPFTDCYSTRAVHKLYLYRHTHMYKCACAVIHLIMYKHVIYIHSAGSTISDALHASVRSGLAVKRQKRWCASAFPRRICPYVESHPSCAKPSS